MKIKILAFILVVLSLLSGCINLGILNSKMISLNSRPEVNVEHVISNNEISQMFLNALYETGFDFKMDQLKYEQVAKTSFSANGKNLFENGYLYKFENLKGEEYAYGQNGAVISFNTTATDDGEIFDTYCLYENNMFDGISNVALPGNLLFGTTFEQSLKDLDIYNAYQSQKKTDNRMIELFNENDEKLYIYLAGWHGEIVDSSLKNISANLIFVKKQNENTMTCSFYYSEGKLFACQYSAMIKSDVQNVLASRDKITAHFYQMPINQDKIVGTIDTIAFTEDSIELTVTIKNTTGKKEVFDYSIFVWFSADNGTELGPFSFEAGKNEKTQTAIYKDAYSSWQNDYLNMYLNLSGLGSFSLSNGSIYYDTSMSR